MTITFLGANQPQSISAGLQDAFAPAVAHLTEWRDYWVSCSGADRLQVGSTWLEPIDRDNGLFQVRFENQLGLTRLQPYAGARALAAPLICEVIASKFGSAEAHAAFFRNLLRDLFSRAAQLPFNPQSSTGRGVREASRRPTPLFFYHWLCNQAPRLLQSLDIILASPQRALIDEPDRVSLVAAAEADFDVLLAILQSPENLVNAPGIAIARSLSGMAPTQVWQRRSRETVDTPPNRFVKMLMGQVLAQAESLTRLEWWTAVPTDRKLLIRTVTSRIRQALRSSTLVNVQELTAFPSQSQVLLRREGYRDMLDLWRSLLHARQPLFAALQQAIDVRDIARLYEMWCFFSLAETVGVCLGESPDILPRVTDEAGLGWGAEARFGRQGTLLYNPTYQRPQSYSVRFRPDFAWVREGRPEIVLDAKFRMEQWNDRYGATARNDDLYKMHAYRDALGVRAALVLFPGDSPTFHRADGSDAVSLRDVLLGDFSGIGAVPMSPTREME